jgi:hypothetical protein
VKTDKDLYTLVERLPKNDPAWNLLDAFDAVTNGMDNPDAMKKALLLKNPDLEPWKPLIKAIQFLYSGETEKCRRASHLIPDNSAPACLKPLFRAWPARGRQGVPDDSGERVAGLFEKLLVQPHPLCLIAEQAEEALRQGLEEQFIVLASRVLCGLKEQSELYALRYGVYCLDLAGAKHPESDFFLCAAKTLGEAGAFCSLGSALVGRDNSCAADALEKAVKTKKRNSSFPGTNDIPAVTELVKFLRSRAFPPAPGPRKKTRPAQRYLFADEEPPEPAPLRGREPGEEATRFRETTLSFLGQTVKNLIGGETLLEILRIPSSFEELSPCLPPVARYLGPGIWMKVIRESQGAKT